MAPTAVAGGVGVLGYIAAWIVAGRWRDGYRPVDQAISELFERGAPAGPRILMTVALVLTGLALVAFGFALHRGLPGRSLAGPIASAVAGVMTTTLAAFPCTAGCPGVGTTPTDTWHGVLAGTGYAALLVAPVLVGVRVRHHLPAFARASIVVGGIALAGFAVRYTGVGDAVGGLQQRAFNTLADLWYLAAAIVIVRRARW